MPGLYKYAIRFLLFLFFFTLSPIKSFAFVDSDGKFNPANWFDDVHRSARACNTVFLPPNNTTSPMGTVVIYNDFDSSIFDNRLQHCKLSGNNLYVYCPGQVEINTSPKIASSLFNLRGINSYYVRNNNRYEIYGYYCSSTGCYGTRDGGGLTGTASPDALQINVIVICTTP